MVDVAEEIEKEEAEKAAQILPEEVKEIEAEEPVLKITQRPAPVYQLDEAVEPAPAAGGPANIAEPMVEEAMSEKEKH